MSGDLKSSSEKYAFPFNSSNTSTVGIECLSLMKASLALLMSTTSLISFSPLGATCIGETHGVGPFTFSIMFSASNCLILSSTLFHRDYSSLLTGCATIIYYNLLFLSVNENFHFGIFTLESKNVSPHQ